jgi:hypothetical protein
VNSVKFLYSILTKYEVRTILSIAALASTSCAAYDSTLSTAPSRLALISFSERAMDLEVEAEADLTAALRSHDDPWVNRNRDSLERALAHIRGQLGWLDVSTDASGAELWVNGARSATLPLVGPVRVRAGDAVIEVRAPNTPVGWRLTRIEPGRVAHETVHLAPGGDAARAAVE